MPKGFFNENEVSSAGCGTSCKLDRRCKSARMPLAGKGKLRVMLVGEAPGKDEDRRGEPFVGESGKELEAALHDIGIDMNAECWKTNAVACRPPDNRTPTPQEIGACRPLLVEAVRTHRPDVVVPLGASAIRSVVGRTWTEQIGTVERWRGWTIPDQELGCWICPTYHPSFIMRDDEGSVARLLWKQDLERAFGMLGKVIPAYRINIDKITGKEPSLEATSFAIREMQCAEAVAFDYETSGLKPDCRGHFIYTVAFSDGLSSTSFRLTDDTEPLVVEMLQAGVPKIAHNAAFEKRWTDACLNVEIHNWQSPHGDTMQNAHVIDNRRGISRLEFQVYVHFGLCWKDETQRFLKADTSNGINNVKKAPLNKLLRRNAIDALVTHMLWQKQTGRIE